MKSTSIIINKVPTLEAKLCLGAWWQVRKFHFRVQEWVGLKWGGGGWGGGVEGIKDSAIIGEVFYTLL